MEQCSSTNRDASWVRDGDDDRTLEENWLFRLRRERYRSRASGQSHDFYVVHLADAVNVVALTQDRRLILVEQFRAGSGRDSLETPGGLLEPGEDPRDAGARELREETGYTGDPAVVLGTSWANSSILSSRITTILITNAVPNTEAMLDVGEEVRVKRVPASKVPALIRSGQIDHALAVQGLLLWMVSELPDHALSLAPSRGKYQIRIASFMVFTAVC
ncbi:MAG: NUDIX hydrolase, partial [Isosphaeraceae bacterium]